MSSSQSSLVDLGSSIQSHVVAIHEALATAGQPDPSFDVNASPTDFNVPNVQDLRTAVLQQIEDLHNLLMTPHETLLGVAATDYVSRHALDRFRVYDHIPVGETRTYTQLADSTGLPVPVIRRLVRHAMTQRIFVEQPPGVVAHTPISKLLAEHAATRDYCGTIAQMVWPAAVHAVDAMQRWPKEAGNADPTKSGLFVACGKTSRALLADDSEQHRRYDSAMSMSRSIMSYSIDHIADGFDWATLGNATVVDVGGGIGSVSIELAKKFHNLDFIVQDRADVIARASLEEEGDDVKRRISYMEHDMFTPQPVQGAAVYLFRRVFMEWTDEQSSNILRNLVSALDKVHSRVIIADMHIPEPGAISRWEERRFRSSDLLALVLSNGGGTRDQERWKEIFKNADDGYVVKQVTPLKNSDMMLTEAMWWSADV